MSGELRGVVCTRGEFVESFHRVHVAVVQEERVMAWHGSPHLNVVYRSAAKPFQALPLVEDGVVDRFGLTSGELALAAASHNGEPPHVEGVRRILEKVGLGEEALRLGPHPPLRFEAAEALFRAGGEVRAIHNNCSGQHAALLGLARVHGWPTESYLDPGHPLQDRMLQEVARHTGLSPDSIATMPDGCGMVAFGVPLASMARSFARLAAGSYEKEGPRRVLGAMAGHPFFLGGTGRLCTALGEVTRGGLVGKLGAEGVYCVAVPEQGLGIAVKVEDGGVRGGDPAVIRVLDQLGLLSQEEGVALNAFRQPLVHNTLGAVVGDLRATFDLEAGEGS